jgi:hypothetical protein
MPKTISRASEKSPSRVAASSKRRHRRMSKEASAAFNVSSFLNDCPYPKGKARVLEIIDLLREMEGLLDDPVVRKVGSIWDVAEDAAVKKTFYAMYEEVQSRLKKYSFHPRVLPPASKKGPWSPGWSALAYSAQTKDAAAEPCLPPPDNPLAVSMFTETNGILSVMNVIAVGSLGRVAQCSHCQTWYGRKFIHQNFCSEKCRIADFRSTPEYREKRNQYARENYKLQRSGKVK